MEELQIFKSPEFGEIRTTEINGEPFFVGRDIAEALGYTNPRKAIIDHVEDDDKGVTKCDTLGGEQEMTIINESGLYSLILSSKLPTAKQFKHWVTSEVLPAIRKTGGYIGNQESMSDDEIMAKALLVAQKTIEQRNKQIEAMQPKALFADAVSASKSSILIGDLAKILKQNGICIGQKRLFAWMRENGYLIKGGSSKNMPTQRAMEMGLFVVKEGSYVNGEGVNVTTKTTKVSGKGQIYFINKFKNA